MLDKERILRAKVEGICFICRLCELWYMGEDRELKDDFGRKRCAATNGCGSPLAGKSFHEYRGPLNNRLERYCFMCGADSTVILQPKVANSKRIGCCERCVDKMKEHTAGQLGPTIVFVSEEVAEPNKFDDEVVA